MAVRVVVGVRVRGHRALALITLAVRANEPERAEDAQVVRSLAPAELGRGRELLDGAGAAREL